jgi:hypothetical protein
MIALVLRELISQLTDEDFAEAACDRGSAGECP